MALLGHPVIRSIEDSIGQKTVTASVESLNHFIQDSVLIPYGQTFYIFEGKVSGLQFKNQTNEMVYELITRIVERSLSDH